MAELALLATPFVVLAVVWTVIEAVHAARKLWGGES